MYPLVPWITARLSPLPLVVHESTAMRSSLNCKVMFSCLSTLMGVKTQLDWIRFILSPKTMDEKFRRK